MNASQRLAMLLAASLALSSLASCGTATPATGAGGDPAQEATAPADAAGYDLLGGTWVVGAITYKGKIIDVNDIEALADLYDNELLGFSSDGTYEHRVSAFVTRGTYEPYEGDRTFLLKAESSSRLTFEDGKLTETEPKDSDKVYLVVMADNDDNTFGYVEFDSMTGKAKAGESPLYFVKNGEESSAISNNKTEVPGTSGKTEDTDSSAPTGYAQKDDSTSGSGSGSGSATPRTTSPTTTTTRGGNQKAIDRAGQYLSTMPFSYEGLVAQLEYEGFSHDDATYAADVCGANWQIQAILKAQQYLKTQAFSKSGLQEQLEYEKFTPEEARHGVENCGADWNEQAVLKARQYMQSLSLSGSRLVEQLEFEGFTHAEAVYGVENA